MQMAEENMVQDAAQPQENHNDGGADWENDENFNDAGKHVCFFHKKQYNSVIFLFVLLKNIFY